MFDLAKLKQPDLVEGGQLKEGGSAGFLPGTEDRTGLGVEAKNFSGGDLFNRGRNLPVAPNEVDLALEADQGQLVDLFFGNAFDDAVRHG